VEYEAVHSVCKSMTQPDNSRVWLITGSSLGLGHQIARGALERGDRVVAAARCAESLDELAASAPERVLAVALDVTSAEQTEAAVAAALERFGRIDVLVNSAGYGSVGAVEEIDMDDVRAVMETLFFGAVALTKAVLPHMRERGSGSIVQISSQAGQLTFPGYGAYCAAKHALEALSEALASEVAPLGIRVLIVEPGAFRTGVLGERTHSAREMPAYAATAGATRAAIAALPGAEPGDPHKLAAAVLAAVDTSEAPLRLALGADAVEAIRAAHNRRRGPRRVGARQPRHGARRRNGCRHLNA
jgi:NAD(P)-dependent dehydrogenase (short-subunit alcohol dehydrogenase family)